MVMGMVLYMGPPDMGLCKESSDMEVEGVGRRLEPSEWGVVIDKLDAFVVE